MKARRNLRTHVLLPADLVQEIDSMVGSRGRSAFLVQTARDAVRRRKLLEFLSKDAPAWTDRDHPELVRGTASWVRKLRNENESRTRKNSRRAKA